MRTPARTSLCGALLIVFALLAWAPSIAAANQARLFAGTFGAASNPAPFPADPYPLEDPQYVAVDESSGDVYVTERFRARVEKFDSEGHFILMFGKGVNETAIEESRPEAERNVCPASGHPADTCQAGQSLGNSTPLEEPGFIAVDNAPGGEGDLYISNGIGASAGLIEKLDPAGRPIATWAASGVLDGSAVTKPPHEVAGPFQLILGIAVDPAGDLWVSEEHNQDFEFNRNGEFAAGFPGFQFGQSVPAHGELAIDSESNLYFLLGNSPPSVNKFDSTGKEIGQVAPSQAEEEAGPGGHEELEKVVRPDHIAIDPATGDLYIDGQNGGTHLGLLRRYDSSCQPTIVEIAPQPGCEAAERFGAGLISDFPGGLAIDAASAAKPIYVADHDHVAVFTLQTVPGVTTTKPLNPTSSSVTLTGTVDPSGIELNEGLQGCRFEWGLATAYGNTAPCDKTAAQIGAGSSPVEVRANITGLQAGQTYHYRLLASNHNDENEFVHQPEAGADLTVGPPLIENASALAVSSSAATLAAEVNPNDLDTHLRIEYVTQAGFEAAGFSEPLSTETLDIGSAGSSQSAEFELSGLAPATAYRYRAVAENGLGEGPEAVLGEALALTTQATSPFGLPDGRAWELVSPPDKRGANLYPIAEQEGVIQAAAGGDAITYSASAPTEASPAGNDNTTQVLSARGPSGWSSRDLNAPHPAAAGTPIGIGPEYRFFSADLSRSLLQPLGAFAPSLSPEATEQSAFLRTDFSAAEPTAFCTASCYRPLVTAVNASSGNPFGEEGKCPPVAYCGPFFLGAGEDLGRIVLSSRVGLTSAPGDNGGLYQWSDGQLSLLSVLPGGTPAPPGSAHMAGAGGVGSRNAVSADGSRVVFATAAGNESLYLRDVAREETVQLDKAGACPGCKSGAGAFQLASADGSRVFFTDVNKLTADSGSSTTGEPKADLYECKIAESEATGQLECRLTDLTPMAGGESVRVIGAPPGAAEDGSYLYFVADGVLTGTQENANHEHAEPGDCVGGSENVSPVGSTCNLYLRHEGTTTFIATLSGADKRDWETSLHRLTARVSPNGRWLAFMSSRPLSGYDNRDAVSGKPDEEVYLYRAPASEGEEGKLLCASCDPTGARPRGVEYGVAGGNIRLAGGVSVWPPDTWLAANVPGWTPLGIGTSFHQSRYLFDSGRLFFNSSDALVPQDSNGTEDVYQYEMPGIGGCTAASPTYSPASGGCVDLISNGTSGEESAFLDASESGDDIFFLTAAQLSGRDEDSALDLYDARVGGGEAQPAKPVACEGDGCQQPATPPLDATPDSLTFQGAGNVIECPRGKVKKAGKCVKKHRAKRHKKRQAKHRRASTNHGGSK